MALSPFRVFTFVRAHPLRCTLPRFTSLRVCSSPRWRYGSPVRTRCTRVTTTGHTTTSPWARRKQARTKASGLRWLKLGRSRSEMMGLSYRKVYRNVHPHQTRTRQVTHPPELQQRAHLHRLPPTCQPENLLCRTRLRRLPPTYRSKHLLYRTGLGLGPGYRKHPNHRRRHRTNLHHHHHRRYLPPICPNKTRKTKKKQKISLPYQSSANTTSS